MSRTPTYCRCHNCKRRFDSLGIARHRKAHLDRGESVKITYSTGKTYRHEPKAANDNEPPK